MKILPLTLRICARLHCGLLAAILSSALFSLLPLAIPSISFSPYAAFWRGILFAIPTALCYYAIKRLPALWQFLLAALGLCALSWLLLGHPGGAVLMALMCLFRVRVRLAEEDEGPIQSFFDRPTLPLLILFAALYLLSAVLAVPSLQKLSLLGGVLYLLLCLIHHGLARVDAYLRLNRDMNSLPARRIRRIAGGAALAGVLLTALLLLPPALLDRGGLRITLPDTTRQSAPMKVEIESASGGDSQPLDMDLSQLMGEPSWQIPEYVSNIFLAVTIAGGLVAIGAGIRSFLRSFRRSYTDSRDLIQHLDREELDQTERVELGLRKPRLWDRSDEANIRRRYRRAVLKAGKEAPKAWHTPSELEKEAGLEIPELHAAYERARYFSER